MIKQANYSTYDDKRVEVFRTRMTGHSLDKLVECFRTMDINGHKCKPDAFLIMENIIYFVIDSISAKDIANEQDKLYAIESKMDVSIEWQKLNKGYEFIIEVKKPTAPSRGPYYIRG